MKFAAFPVADAAGMILAHSVRVNTGIFKKGRTLSADNLRSLQASGHETVYAACLDETDVPEDEAAAALAKALTGECIRAEVPFTGRANLYATANGVIQLDEALIHKVNAIDEAVTIATLRNWDGVHERQMVATVKIIPFAVPRQVLNGALKTIADNGDALSIAPYKLKRADLILTTVTDLNPKLLAKAEVVISDRLKALGVELTSVRHCPHTENDLAACLAPSESTSELTLILGASATVDRLDVVPSAILKAGGTVKHFGMPVDPGNLLLLADISDRPVLGLPGCARSPKLNGADWVLQRLAAGLSVTPSDIQSMGVGGLLKEIPSRPQPRGRKKPETSSPRVAAIILAAGQSRRMGDVNKLTATVEGKPMVAHVADAALASNADEIILVTGHQEETILTALAGRPMTHVLNINFQDGLSSSVRTGVRAAAEITPALDAAIILLGDMPFVDAQLINQLIDAHNRDDDAYICVPTVNGKRGNPVLWDAAFFAELQALEGDVGAKHLIVENADLVCEVAVAGKAALTDIDTPEMLSKQETL